MTARRLLAEPPAGTTVLVSAPGRANLIGEYTDINEGYVLPVGLDLRTVLAGSRTSGRLVLRSLDLPGDGVVEMDLQDGSGPTTGWGRYATAVVAEIRRAGLAMHGFTGVLASDVPMAAGLSSSAALEVALALALLAEPVDPGALAQLCRRAENDGVGVQSGIMDQLCSVAAERGCALLLDCRDLSMLQVPLPPGLAVLVVDCDVRRELSTSAYNDRRAECARAAVQLGVDSLRDVTADELDDKASLLDDVTLRRARHVVTENARVVEVVDALHTGDLAALGHLFEQSHRSLADDFEVSIRELDLLAEVTRATPGVHASRLTGAGFGGCTVSLVDAATAGSVRDEVLARYAAASGRTSRGWVSRAADGARVHSR